MSSPSAPRSPTAIVSPPLVIVVELPTVIVRVQPSSVLSDGLDPLMECAVGLERCADDAPCPLHDTWKGLRTQVMNYLETTTLAEMARAVARKKELVRRHAPRKN